MFTFVKWWEAHQVSLIHDVTILIPHFVYVHEKLESDLLMLSNQVKIFFKTAYAIKYASSRYLSNFLIHLHCTVHMYNCTYSARVYQNKSRPIGG